jgi:mannose-6-phosphate isomerase-like protein (cupin superfamily)
MSDSKTAAPQYEISKGTNYTAFDGGTLSNWADLGFEHPKRGPIKGKFFLKDIIEFTGCEISVNSLQPGASVPFRHAHKENEEVYIFIKGAGQMQIDEEYIDVKEGSIVRISPAGVRCWRNNSKEPLVYVVIQVREKSLRQHTSEDGILSDKPPAWPD